MNSDPAFVALLVSYQSAARKRDIAWELTDSDFARLIREPCHFCRIPPAEFARIVPSGSGDYVHGEVGRIDSADGFTPDNSIPCCQICARGLAGSSYREHLEWLQRITAFQTMKRVDAPEDMFPEA